jgi:hypothetical protein
MTGADGSADLDIRPGWRWDVALSFAGAQRPYVEQVAAALKERGLRCFYDADEQIELWGRYLVEELPAIYGEQAAAVVVFISAEYAARDWARLERRAALNRAVRERREYVLPARFDDTPLPGLLSDMVAIDLHTRTPEQFAAMIANKLAALAITALAPSADAGNLARDVESAPPAGAVCAGDVDPRRLGVHAAISVPEVPDEFPPEYVPRDADAGIRARVRLRRSGAGSCCWSADPRWARPGARWRRSRRCYRIGGWYTRSARVRLLHWRGRLPRRWWCGWMSCSATWMANMV